MTEAQHSLLEARLFLQSRLDAAKSQAERNELGQFATPPALAHAILKITKTYFIEPITVRFFDPAFGTGAFYEALKATFSDDEIISAKGVEIDAHYGEPARIHWQKTALELDFADFTQLSAPATDANKPNLIVCNPPYVRHHHLAIQQKQRLGEKVKKITGIKVNGLAGLYCYFLLLSHAWMAENGIGCWLIPSEFFDVNYGQAVKEYLLNQVTLLRIHRFDPLDRQFDDALVSSVAVWFRNASPHPDNTVEFTFGGKLEQPQQTKIFLNKHLDSRSKWSNLSRKEVRPNEQLKISDLFHIKRGIATGANKFFILTQGQIQQHQLPSAYFSPILPSPRYLESDEILADENKFPLLQKSLFLLNCPLSEEEIQANHPGLWRYLESGKRKAIHERYLCRHRTPWYAQEFRLPAPILCTYMGRNEEPFKFIRNYSKAVAPNVYLMLYPKKNLQVQIQTNPELLTEIWQALRSLRAIDLIREGRVYGGGLFKLEPRELGNTSLPGFVHILPETQMRPATQLPLFQSNR